MVVQIYAKILVILKAMTSLKQMSSADRLTDKVEIPSVRSLTGANRRDK